MPWSSALRSRCSSGPTSFSSTERSSSTCVPRISRLARLSSSFAVWRRMRYRRSDRLPNGTVRIENSCCCTSRDSRACASSAASASSRLLQQRLLDGRHVVDALGEAARQFLEARVAVELQRIEASARLVDHRHARLDLRLGLDFDLAHLRAQADHAVGQLEQVALERAQLALDAGARDRDLAGLVDQTIDQVGAHAQHRALRGFAFAPAPRAAAARRRGGAAARPAAA